MKRMSKELGEAKKQMEGFEKVGKCYHKLADFEKSIICFKKQLEYAWESKDKSGEMNAYDNLGLGYFYLGDLDGADYYHNRMVRGKCEDSSSDMRQLVTSQKSSRSQNRAIQNRPVDPIFKQFRNLLSKNQEDQKNTVESQQEQRKREIRNLFKNSFSESDTPTINCGTPISDISTSGLPSPRSKFIFFFNSPSKSSKQI